MFIVVVFYVLHICEYYFLLVIIGVVVRLFVWRISGGKNCTRQLRQEEKSGCLN